jgi:hypothetical protein
MTLLLTFYNNFDKMIMNNCHYLLLVTVRVSFPMLLLLPSRLSVASFTAYKHSCTKQTPGHRLLMTRKL